MNGYQETEQGACAPTGFARSATSGVTSGNSMPPPLDRPALVKRLESILTIDGQGRPAKARMLLQLLGDVPNDPLIEALKEIGNRKFF